MNKIEVWRKGDKITADKLNDAVEVINELIEAEESRLNKDSNAISASFTATTYTENIPSWYQEITPLWDNDGEGIIYDTWDGLPDADNGLYARSTGINALTATRIFTESELSLYKQDSDVKAGQQLVQVIRIAANGDVVGNTLAVYETVADIPSDVIAPNATSTLYRRVSRIVEDSTHAAPTDSTKQTSSAWKYKAVATNDFTISPITTNADVAATDKAQLVRASGLFAKVKGIENEGGLTLTNGNTTVGLESGIEIYGSSDSSHGSDYTDVTTGVTPNPKPATIASFPITHTVYDYDHTEGQYIATEESSDNLTLVAEPINGNAWQWGIKYKGEVGLDTYRYQPADMQIEQVTDPLPEDGKEGWILTLYLPMIYHSNGTSQEIYSFKQMMRFYNGKLQVSAQRSKAPNGTWESYFSSEDSTNL